MRPLRLALAFALVAVTGCGSNESPSGSQGASSGKSSAATAPGAGTIAIRPTGLVWTAPPSFTLVQSPSPMRLATYRVARADGDPEDAEMTVTQVGGGVEKNIDRWKNQLEGATVREQTDKTVGGLKVTILWVEGTYQGMSMPNMPPSTPKENYALLGAAVTSGAGDEHYFKMTGPKKTVEAARPAFDELVQSLATQTH
ncbi:MAG: hypothetical protein HOW73_37120 [Polyangiaceae bacterium]|nr:hypothetical protein [Polyangiaceae bacterium]